MAEDSSSPPVGGMAWPLKLFALAIATAAVGIPINGIFGYGLLVIAALLIFTGAVRAAPRRWLLACCIVMAVIGGKWLTAPPWIEEGHNVFLGEHNDALKAGLPGEIFAFMQRQFDEEYPLAKRCDPDARWCWRGVGLLYFLRARDRDGDFPTYRTCFEFASNCLHGFPDRTYAFSADGIFQSPVYSRRVTSIDFSDPAWLRLGFLNDGAYNWANRYSDVKRAVLYPDWLHGIHRWRITMPWFVMYQFPKDYIGSRLCWRGDVLWQTSGTHFEALHHDREACRTLTAVDAGRKIFGIAVKPDTLAMTLRPTRPIRLANWLALTLTFAGVALTLVLLVKPNFKRAIVPAVLIAGTLALIAMIDVTTLGGLRAQEGGDDGLFYEAAARVIVQHLMAGDLSSMLEGTERVYYFGGPGFRYLIALERILFGETNLGYVSLLLIFPLVVWRLFHRFLSQRWAVALSALFLATPFGAFFGSTFFFYVKYAIEQLGDPASYLFYLAALAIIVGPTAAGPNQKFAPALGAALLFALSLFVRPIVAPAVAVLLGGAGLAALWLKQWQRLAGLCAGFLPVVVMPLHNWYFGNVFILFSDNAVSNKLHMTPTSYVVALSELIHRNFAGPELYAAYRQLLDFPVEFIGQWETTGLIVYLLAAAFHVVAIGVTIYVAAARRYDPWLRLTAGAALAQHVVGLFYGGAIRYFFLAWFLTMLAVAVWCEDAFAVRLNLHWSRLFGLGKRAAV